MTWTQLLANNEVQRYKTSKKELDKLRAVIRRDLADASLDGASSDRRFAIAYNAADCDQTKEFVEVVEQWIAKTHPSLKT